MNQIAEQFLDYASRGCLAHAYIVEMSNDVQPFIADVQNKLGIAEQDTQRVMPVESVSIRIDQVRAVQDRLSRSPHGDKHLVVFTPADRMNTATSNALLKLLEEPPGSALFLLITDNSKQLLQTIRSRTQVIRSDVTTLDCLHTHPEFDRIKLIYADAPSMLKECDDTPLAIILNDSLHQSKCLIKVLADVAQLSPVTLINTAITLVSAMIKQQPSHDIKIWQAYDQLNTLKRQYQVAHNLNEKALVDRISCVLTPLAAYAV
jgi:DNA polymerase-3 subunit delta'